MNPNQTPIKTTKGLQEIGNRTFNLPTEMRRVLIMINGRSTVEELRKKLVGFGEIDSILVQLEIDGLIAPNPAANPPPEISQRPTVEISRRPHELSQRPVAKDSRRPAETSQRQTPALIPVDSQAEFNMEKAKGFVRFVLFGAMGPSAERRINRIEATTTPEELRVELDAIHDMLPKVLSKKEAQQAWRQLEPIMISLDMAPS